MRRDRNLLSTLVFLIPLCIFIALPHNVAAGQRSGQLSEKNYLKLSVIHNLIEEEKTAEALHSLDSLILSVKGDDYATALVYQTYGYAYIGIADYSNAITAFDAALSLSVLPKQVSNRIRYDLAQLYFETEKYQAGTALLEKWFLIIQNPSPDAHVLAASGYVELKQFQKAIPHLNQAINGAVAPNEGWYSALLSIYDHLSDHDKALELLKVMVGHFPTQPSYWKRLARLYMVLAEESKALATLELAHKQGLLGEDEIIYLTDLYLIADLPYEAGRLLEEGLNNGIVKSTPEHWERLSRIWQMSKEDERARMALTRKASKIMK